MELYEQIIANILAKQASDAYAGFKMDMAKAVESECYTALKKIKAIIEDDSLDENEYSEKTEQILRVMDCMGSTPLLP